MRHVFPVIWKISEFHVNLKLSQQSVLQIRLKVEHEKFSVRSAFLSSYRLCDQISLQRSQMHSFEWDCGLIQVVLFESLLPELSDHELGNHSPPAVR